MAAASRFRRMSVTSLSLVWTDSRWTSVLADPLRPRPRMPRPVLEALAAGDGAFVDLMELHHAYLGSAVTKPAQPLTAPPVSPRASCFWTASPNMSTGSMMIALLAYRRPQSTALSVIKPPMYGVTVRAFPLVRISA